jgi:signal transduction histidine kinase
VAGVVRVSSSTAQLSRRTWLTWAAMAGLAALALAVAAVLARRQAHRLTRPLTELAGAARALGDGDFTASTPRSGVAEIDTASSALDDTAARLDQLLARERAFSANASHQLRTPLTGLRLTLEAALEGDDAGLRAATEGAIDAADRLERTIDELLSVARSGTARRGPLDVDALLDDLYGERAGPLGLAGRPLRVERQDDLPPVAASRAAIRQILAVLIDNATVHGDGAITVVARDAEDALAFDVSDEGAGPPAGVDLFDRARPRSQPPGIGLPLARALAEAEGGRLVLTATGRQTIFTLFLPAAPGEGSGATDPG